ncbi:MAG: hypothetical protein HYY48_11895 [Gammaproteobacteria bacterium]|nr:hypothetical protein [Gammaproteobacteria bacterium]
MRALSIGCLLLFAIGAWAEDYPTQDTVEMVVLCMSDIGGQSEENLYTCACRHDVIKAKMTFRDYENASLVERYQSMPGKKGQLFRDFKDGEKLFERLKAARKEATAQCPEVKRIVREPPKK